LPDSARSLGRSLRIFKSEVQEMNKDDSKEDKKTDPSSEK
jgi:sec-independent protein translocase protein TatA